MLLVLTGSGCSGKSTLAFAVAGRLRQVAVHDFDEVGVPPGADLRWRQRMTEHWVRRALEYQDDGIDLLLPGQSPLGEVLAGPSAPRLDGVAVCLVDVADDVAGRGLRPTVLRSPLARSSTGPRGTVATRMTRSTGLPSSSRAAGRRWPGTGGTGGSAVGLPRLEPPAGPSPSRPVSLSSG